MSKDIINNNTILESAIKHQEIIDCIVCDLVKSEIEDDGDDVERVRQPIRLDWAIVA